MKKRIISVLLTVVMVIGTMPLSAMTAFANEGKTVEITQYSDYTYIVSVKDITATELADSYTVTVRHGEDTMTLKGAVLDYCVAVINAHRDKTTDKDVKAVNAMAAFYEYYEAAEEYVKNPSASLTSNLS